MGNKLPSTENERELLPPTQNLRVASLELPIAYENTEPLNGVACSLWGWIYIVYGHSIIVLDHNRAYRGSYGHVIDHGNKNGPANKARFNEPIGIRFIGDTLLICDSENGQIRAIETFTSNTRHILPLVPIGKEGFGQQNLDLNQTAAGAHEEGTSRLGEVKLYSGGVIRQVRDGPIESALWKRPMDLAAGKFGNDSEAIFVLDGGTIRVISLGMVITIADNIETPLQPLFQGVFPNNFRPPAISLAVTGDFAFISFKSYLTASKQYVVRLRVSDRDLHLFSSDELVFSKTNRKYLVGGTTGLCGLSNGRVIGCERFINSMAILDAETLQRASFLSDRRFYYESNDGDYNVASTCMPHRITVSPVTGDLVWSESGHEELRSHSMLRMIFGFETPAPTSLQHGSLAPSIRKLLRRDGENRSTPTTIRHEAAVGPELILVQKSPHRFGDLELLHEHSSTHYYLNSFLLTLVAPEMLLETNLEQLKKAKVSAAIFDSFLAILHGAEPRFQPSHDDHELICHEVASLLHLACLAGLNSTNIFVVNLKRWFLQRFTLLPVEIGALVWDQIQESFADTPEALDFLKLASKRQKDDSDLLALKSHFSSSEDASIAPDTTLVSQMLSKVWEVLEPAQSLLKDDLEDMEIFILLRRPQNAFRAHLQALLSDNAPSFEIHINGRKQIYLVHDWLLFCRWPYFKRLIESGLEESSQRSLVLPSHFPVPILEHLLHYVYTLQVPPLTASDASWIIEYGAEFDFLSIDGTPANGFPIMFYAVQRFLGSGLTILNALDILEVRLRLKDSSQEIADILAFLSRNIFHFYDSNDLRERARKFLEDADPTQVPEHVILTVQRLYPNTWTRLFTPAPRS